MSRVSSGMALVLHPAMIYLSPTNRRCRWVGSAQDDAADGKRVDSNMADGFTLTAGNVSFMRRVA